MMGGYGMMGGDYGGGGYGGMGGMSRGGVSCSYFLCIFLTRVAITDEFIFHTNLFSMEATEGVCTVAAEEDTAAQWAA